ncbi:MAG: LEA type 2 family protein [Bacteroidota bacterium]
MDKSIFHYVGIGAVAWLVLRRFLGGVVERVQLVKAKASTPRFDLDSADFVLTLTLKNQLPFSIPSNTFTGVLRYGNDVLANINTSLISIGANESKDVPFDVSLSYGQLGTSLVNIIRSGELLRAARIEGTLYSNGISVPISQTITLV